MTCNSKEQTRSFIYLVQKVERYVINEAPANSFVRHAAAYASSLLPTAGIAMWDTERTNHR